VSILNANTDSHPFHQPNKRSRGPRRAKQILPHSGLATDDCKGSHEERQTWMRRRQQAIREAARKAGA
jgi:hypothetical protein